MQKEATYPLTDINIEITTKMVSQRNQIRRVEREPSSQIEMAIFEERVKLEYRSRDIRLQSMQLRWYSFR